MMDGNSVLVVEDDTDILELITYTLDNEGFKVFPAKSAREALAVLNDETVDLAVLDVMLPDMTGTELCRRMRREERMEEIPVLFVTAKTEETDKLEGFRVGADDYLTKPFSPRELAARAKALLKRSKGGKELHRFGGLQLDFSRHKLEVDGREVGLTPLEFKVLKVLIEGRGKTIARAALLERAWGMDAKAGLRSVDVSVTRLRDKLKPYGKCIRTVMGFGYQWDPAAASAIGKAA